MLFYPAALPRSAQTLTYVAGILRRYGQQIGSPWRKLTFAQRALLVLAYLRRGETFPGDRIRTPCKGKNKPESQKAANRAHAKLRGPGERANVQLKPGASCASSVTGG